MNSKSKINIGIDIGKHGAICINDQGNITTYPMPMIKTELDYLQVYNLLSPYEGGRVMVVFERLGVIFGSSKQVAFSMGHQAGAIEMACVALAIPFTKVPPKQWQKEMFTGVDEITSSKGSRDTKAMALVAVKRLLPTLKLTFGTRATVPHDGLVDAVLMSLYSERKL